MSEVESELGALVQEMQNLEKAMEALDEIFKAATLKSTEDALHTILTTTQHDVDRFFTDFTTLGADISSLHTPVTGVFTDLDSFLDAHKPLFDNALATFVPQGHELTGDLDTITATIEKQNEQILSETNIFDETITSIEADIVKSMDVFAASMNAATHDLEAVLATFLAVENELAAAIAAGDRFVTDFVDHQYLAPLATGLHTFDEVTKQVADAVLAHPIGALIESFKNLILTEIKEAFEGTAHAAETGMNEAVAHLDTAGTANDASSKAIAAAFHELEPVWKALHDALRAVQSIWDTVKSAVSAL